MASYKNPPLTRPKDRVPSLYRSAIRILDDIELKARAVAAARPAKKADALKDLKEMRDTFAVWVATYPAYAVECFERMSQLADLFMLGDGRLSRIIADADRKVARAFTAAVYVVEKEKPADSDYCPSRLRIDVAKPGEFPFDIQFYARDIAKARIVIQTCYAFINKPKNWHESRNFVWHEVAEQIYGTAVGRADDANAHRFGCTNAVVRQRRKRAWDFIEGSLAWLGIIGNSGAAVTG